jgi:hypothetical protein
VLVLCDESSNSVQCGETFGTDIQPDEIPLQTNASPKNPVLVNNMEKIAPAEFSIREFGSVSRLGSQTNILKRLWLVVDSGVGRHLRCHYFCHYFPLSLLEQLRVAAISRPIWALR